MHKIAVFSDVHGNLPALQTVLADCEDVDGFICLGDLINYGPWSNECVETILDLDRDCILIEGNHEQYFRERKFEGAHPIARAFFRHCFPGFKHHDYLLDLRQHYMMGTFTFTHTIDNSYIYSDTKVSIDSNYVIGHSHCQFKRASNGWWLYNIGSVGQNRQVIDVAEYAWFFPEENRLIFRRLRYDFETVIEKMRADAYPTKCIDYLLNKRRYMESDRIVDN